MWNALTPLLNYEAFGIRSCALYCFVSPCSIILVWYSISGGYDSDPPPGGSKLHVSVHILYADVVQDKYDFCPGDMVGHASRVHWAFDVG